MKASVGLYHPHARYRPIARKKDKGRDWQILRYNNLTAVSISVIGAVQLLSDYIYIYVKLLRVVVELMVEVVSGLRD